MKKHWHFLAICLLAAAASTVYFGPFLDNFFAYDSFRYIGNLAQGPKTVMLGYNAFRVVSNFTWYPLYFFSGFDPFGYNLFNDSLFALNACLVYLVTFRLWENRELSLLSAGIVALYTTACDAVFWHMSLSTLLCCTFYLLTLASYIKHRKTGKRGAWWSALTLYTVAMYTKEDAASLPFILVLIDLFYFQGMQDLKGVARRVAPFAGIIILYLVSSNLVFYILHVPSETAQFFEFRPLYSALAGFTVFFLSPDGWLSLDNPLIPITAAVMVLSFFLVRDRKLLLFGYLWILFTFLPQSLSRIGQFRPKFIFNSISRLLYLPQIGAALVFTALLLRVKEKYGTRPFLVTSCLFFTGFFYVNYNAVQLRGEQWRTDAAPVLTFLQELKKVVPSFPEHSYVTVVDPPTGTTYVQQALRAFYQHRDINRLDDPVDPQIPAGAAQYIIIYNWDRRPDVPVEAYRLR